MNAPLDPEIAARADRQAQVVRALEAVVPAHALLWQREDTTPYECDGLTAYRQRPLAVVLPETEAQVQAVLRACHALDVPVVARGAGTGGRRCSGCAGVSDFSAKDVRGMPDREIPGRVDALSL